MVVVWHWAFTILRWTPDGPMPTSPLGFFSGLWIFTWLLQVMPMFFYVGGYVHLVSWRRARERGDSLASYVRHQITHLVVPAGVLVLTWAVLGATAASLFNLRWIRGAVLLIISPLWFLTVYVGLLALLPVSLWLHRKFDVVVLVWLGGVALGADVLRFRYGLDRAGWVNMIAVWGLAHQAGFFYHRVVDAPRRWGHALLWAGLFGLAGLVFSGLYPGSMVGVPGDRLSNMAPPTFVIVALLTFQAGFAEVTRPFFERRLGKRRWQRFIGMLSTYALPLFLFHTTGMALAKACVYFVFGSGVSDDRPPDVIWWLERPIAVLGPLLCTLPFLLLFGARRTRAGRRRDLRPSTAAGGKGTVNDGIGEPRGRDGE
ncbi:acyltransferase family protein [Amycolatopsis orientalis]|uniref:acyltransferase family protein n=1 Tax=Amycolatopsis orientalis TaxID=31958 RepID=UPI000403846D|nr:acyltransferase [Amycolatopsis orientalis]